jgi:hypothetical protein
MPAGRIAFFRPASLTRSPRPILWLTLPSRIAGTRCSKLWASLPGKRRPSLSAPRLRPTARLLLRAQPRGPPPRPSPGQPPDRPVTGRRSRAAWAWKFRPSQCPHRPHRPAPPRLRDRKRHLPTLVRQRLARHVRLSARRRQHRGLPWTIFLARRTWTWTYSVLQSRRKPTSQGKLGSHEKSATRAKLATRVSPTTHANRRRRGRSASRDDRSRQRRLPRCSTMTTMTTA